MSGSLPKSLLRIEESFSLLHRETESTFSPSALPSLKLSQLGELWGILLKMKELLLMHFLSFSVLLVEPVMEIARLVASRFAESKLTLFLTSVQDCVESGCVGQNKTRQERI